MLRKPLALAAALIAVALQAPSAHAAPALAGTFPSGQLSGPPGRLAAGSDGNVWFTINSPTNDLGRITPSGTVTEFSLTGNPSLIGLTAGPDGNLWATTIGDVIKIPPGDPTSATSFADANIGSSSEITVGPDGNLWAGDATNGVIKIPPGSPGNGVGGEDHDFTGVLAGKALGLTAGGDGNIWIADNTNDANSQIVRVNTSGVVQGTPTPAGNSLQQSELAAGVGQVVFTEPIGGGVPERVGRVDFSGNVQFTDMPNGLGDPVGITFGNDGAYWIANFGANAVRRMTPAGDVTSPITFDANSGPRQITKGPNDTLWVSLETSQKIAKITGVSAPPSPPPPPPPPPPGKTARAAIKGKHVLTVSGRFVTIPLVCSGSSTCKGTITLRTAKAVAAAKKKKKRVLKLGSARFSIAAGHTKRVRIKLSTKATKFVRKHRTVKAVAVIGGKSTKVTLKRKK